jgi:ABC-type nitrate/sulfonate/bicarbonate transport system substrate-binding protein
MGKKVSLISFFMVFILLFAACSGTKDQAQEEGSMSLEPVTVVLDWFPNTNHTGLYVALEKGFFADEGLDVEIIQPGEGNTSEQLVASGQVQFGVSYQEAVTQARAQDVPVVSIAAVIQHNTSAFASLKEDGIETVKDFEGKRYGGWGSPVEEAVLRAVMEKAGADYALVENVTLGTADFFQSVGRTVDFAWIYYGWDGVEAERRGMELNLIMLKDLDPALDYYTPVLITSEQMIEEQEEIVRRFVSAVAQGYEFAIDKPDEAAEILIAHAPELNEELVLESQRWLSDQYQADAPQWGVQKGEVWERYAQWMLERDLIPKMIDTEQAYTNAFLPER